MSDFLQTRVGAALKDAVLAAVITLLLASIMVGLRTKTEQGGLVIVGQWGLVAWMVGIVFVGRLAMSLLVWRGNNPVANAMNAMLPKQDTVSKIGKFVGPLLLLFAVTLPFYGQPLYHRHGHSGAHLHHARLGASISWWVWPVCLTLAMLPSMRWVPIHTLSSHSISTCPSGSVCRSQAFWPPSGA